MIIFSSGTVTIDGELNLDGKAGGSDGWDDGAYECYADQGAGSGGPGGTAGGYYTDKGVGAGGGNGSVGGGGSHGGQGSNGPSTSRLNIADKGGYGGGGTGDFDYYCGAGGGGSGGRIHLESAGTITKHTTGLITAKGGNATNGGGGGIIIIKGSTNISAQSARNGSLGTGGQASITFSNELPYKTSGTFESAIVDLSESIYQLNTMTFVSSTGQMVTADVRTAATIGEITGTTYVTGIASGSDLPPSLDGKRYMQYILHLSTSLPSQTPTVDAVTINYALKPTFEYSTETGYAGSDGVNPNQVLKILLIRLPLR